MHPANRRRLVTPSIGRYPVVANMHCIVDGESLPSPGIALGHRLARTRIQECARASTANLDVYPPSSQHLRTSRRAMMPIRSPARSAILISS